MKRYAATIILGLGLVFGVVIGGANLAGAATTAHATKSASFTFNSGVGTKPGHGSGLSHMKATKVGTSSNTDPYTAPAKTATPTPAAATPSPAANTVATSPASSLAFTGADVTGAVVLGLLLIGGGLVLVGATRRRQLI